MVVASSAMPATARAEPGWAIADEVLTRMAKRDGTSKNPIWETDAQGPLAIAGARFATGIDLPGANDILVHASEIYLAPGVCMDSPNCDPGKSPTYQRGVLVDAGIYLEWGKSSKMTPAAKSATLARLEAIRKRGLCYTSTDCLDPKTRSAWEFTRSENHTLIYAIGKYLSLVALGDGSSTVADIEAFLDRFLVEHGKYGWAETRSGIYDPINLGPMFALARWSPNARLRTLALMTVDTWLSEGLVTGPAGISAGSAMRAYPGTYFDDAPVTNFYGTASTMYLGTKLAKADASSSATFCAAMSTYRAPKALLGLVDAEKVGSYDYAISFDLPFAAGASRGRRASRVTKDYALGAMQQYGTYLPKISGANVWGDQYLGDVVFPMDPTARVVFVGGDRFKTHQDYRIERGWTTEDVMLLRTGRSGERTGIAVQKVDQALEKKPWLLIREGSALVGWRPGFGDYTKVAGHYGVADLYAMPDEGTPAVVVVARLADEGSIDAFGTALLARDVTYVGSTLCTKTRSGAKACFDYTSDTPSIDGKVFAPGTDRVKSKWVNAPGVAGVWTILAPSGEKLVLDFPKATRDEGVDSTPPDDAGTSDSGPVAPSDAPPSLDAGGPSDPPPSDAGPPGDDPGSAQGDGPGGCACALPGRPGAPRFDSLGCVGLLLLLARRRRAPRTR